MWVPCPRLCMAMRLPPFTCPRKAVSMAPNRDLLARRDKAIDALTRRCVRHVINLSLFILAERENRQTAVLDRPVGDDTLLVAVVLQGPDLRRHVIAVDVVSVEFLQALAAVYVTAGEGLTDVMVVFPDGLDHVLVDVDAASAEGVQTFATVPAIVAAL